MLGKFKIWIYENWLRLIFSFFITFLFLKNIYLSLFLYFLILIYSRGSFFQALFFSLLFLILAFIFSQQFFLPLLFYPLLFLIIFYSLKKNKILPWLIFFLINFFLFYFNFSEKLNLPLTIFFFTFIVFYFNLIFLQYDFFKSLTFSFLSLEASFLFQFLPTSFFTRLVLFFVILFFALKFDIIEKINARYPNNLPNQLPESSDRVSG